MPYNMQLNLDVFTLTPEELEVKQMKAIEKVHARSENDYDVQV